MKTKIKELREKTEKELRDLLSGAQDELRDCNFKVAARELKNIRSIRETKRTIARINTLLTSLNNKK